MRLWRLYRRRYGRGLDGIGGTLADGRWHTRGERVVYFGGSAAIVVLERLAHTDPDLLPDDLWLAQFDFLEAIAEVHDFGDLPADWVREEKVTRRIGGLWHKQGPASLLRVPSAILPEESNYVYNPDRTNAGRLRLVGERRFRFDPRLI